ncbi:MAG: zinc ribbon domain-containing protein [Pirellulaceae bacterium]|jgi:predicted amidophosphoribosyltransferase|nr:zinc ribbon domain-containing protein [Pirellulaceae bacterium]MDP6554194.1 zinc ribbon domain-containing protein [Pirellulaceae bacterium]MDP6719373.1 zinc ribbon domain-containing protein [Pirellulaceae bacterium]
MFAFFGMPGYIELLIIGMLGLVLVGAPLFVVVIVLLANRGQQQTTECPKCGKVSPQSGFCPHCGAKSTKED